MIRDDLKPFSLDMTRKMSALATPCNARPLRRPRRRRSFAISAVDTALWDLRGKANGRSLRSGWRCSKCNKPIVAALTSIPPREIARTCKLFDHQRRQIKVGREASPKMSNVLDRMIGADIAFMVDANYASAYRNRSRPQMRSNHMTL